EAAALYTKRPSAIPGLKTAARKEWAESVYHLYVIRVRDRDALAKRLEAKGIGTGIHYPLPNHLQPASLNDRRVRSESLPATEAAVKDILSLPMFPTITDPEVEYVCDAVAEHHGVLAGK